MTDHRNERPQVWPVIHLASTAHALDNAAVAAECGCHGVFLIQMEGKDEMIDPAGVAVRDRFPGLKVGVNYLSMDPASALVASIKAGHHATWTDESGVRTDETSPFPALCVDILKQSPAHLFFAGVAFKYLRTEPDPPRAAAMAAGLGFVSTTTGPKTGSPPNPEKLAAMRAALGPDAPLAVASGISPENVEALGPYLSHILVATGVARPPDDLDPDRLRLLMERLPRRAV